MKTEAATMKQAKAVVVWPVAPEAERLSQLMRAKARPQKAELNKLKGRSAR